jgi:succinate dehydrogenase (ubiquinone) membrane anchor subunit
MASAARSVLLRQTALVSAAARSAQPMTSSIASMSRSAFVQPLRRDAFQSAARVAAFHTTSKRDLLPPGPQVLEGGINEPTPVPSPHPSHGSYHWTFERILAVGLIPLTVTPFAAGSLNPTTDAILCAAILIHSHMGFQAVVIDYVPSRRFPKSRKLVNWSLNLATLLVAVGLYEFETNDVGVTEAIKRIWQA